MSIYMAVTYIVATPPKPKGLNYRYYDIVHQGVPVFIIITIMRCKFKHLKISNVMLNRIFLRLNVYLFWMQFFMVGPPSKKSTMSMTNIMSYTCRYINKAIGVTSLGYLLVCVIDNIVLVCSVVK